MVALLRGINVGGKTTLPMADLRAAVEGCGYTDVRTYIQSGNVVLTTSGRSTAPVAAAITTAVADLGGIAPDVVVRTRAQLQAVVDANPYLARGEDPKHLHVVFLTAPAATSTLDDLPRDPGEEVQVIGSEVHLLLPGGVGRSTLATALAKRKGERGTMRNWNTVTKLLAMADEVAGP